VITRCAEGRPLFSPAALAFLAILGSFAGEGFSSKVSAHTPDVFDSAQLQACGEAQSAAAPGPADCFITPTIVPLRPCLPVAAGEPADSGSTTLVPPQTCSEVQRHAVLVDALILTKYQHFRESLSAP
jgi:hypothetical protein